MSDQQPVIAGRVRGVLIPDAACPALSRLLWEGRRALTTTDGWVPPVPVQTLIDVITETGQAFVLTRKGSENGIVAGDGGENRKQSSEQVSTRTAAGILGVSERRVRHLITAGKLPATRLGHQHLITRKAIDDYCNTRRSASTGAGAGRCTRGSANQDRGVDDPPG